MTSRRILVVDDDPTTLIVLSRLLTGEGFVTEAAACAAAALEHLRASSFDILLTDLVMPEMDGLELTIAAREIRPLLRCVIMSGHARGEDMPSNDADWILKPIDIDTLLGVLAAPPREPHS